MKAYVINLPRSTERRHHIETELRKAGLEHEFVQAIDGQTLSRADWPDWLSLNLVGAGLSHLNAYRAIIRDGGVGLVLEDDAVLPPALPDLDVPDGSVALLHYLAHPSEQRCRLAGPGPLLRPLDPVSGGTAYLITPAACHSLLRFSPPNKGYGPDDWRHFPITTWCVEGRPVGQRTDFPSSIGYAKHRYLVPRWIRTLNRRRIARRARRFERV